MSISSQECRMQAVSNDYYDFIGDLQADSSFNQLLDESFCVQRVSEQYIVIYDRAKGQNILFESPYSTIPKCYGLMDEESLNEAGIDRIRQYPGLMLTGRDVIMGIIDTGIDYRNDVFKKEDGTTRIIRIWDQEDQSGVIPSGFLFGSEYTGEQIDEALSAEDPLSVVPSMDTNGHGTAVAAIAAGSEVPEEGFSGSAPGADIAVVKLKPAKQYLRDYYLISQQADAYQENDIMLGVLYLQRLSYSLQKSLVICLAIGTGQGDHAGGSPLGVLLNEVSRQRMRCVVVGTGNEANEGRHFYGNVSLPQEYQDVEIRVGENERGFVAELWTDIPNRFGVSVLSPSGERLPQIPMGLRSVEEYEFLFEGTRLQVFYRSSERESSSALVFMRFEKPVAGIWTIRVFPVRNGTGDYHIWLPISAFLTSDTYFLQPSPDVTLTGPSGAELVISTGAYNGQTGSIYVNSGRGYNRKGAVKPELCAPGVNVLTALPGNRFARRTGTSMAAGITAGAAALMLEWYRSIRQDDTVSGVELKGYLISGARRDPDRRYPNRECGYGTLDLYRTFEALRIR